MHINISISPMLRPRSIRRHINLARKLLPLMVINVYTHVHQMSHEKQLYGIDDYNHHHIMSPWLISATANHRLNASKHVDRAAPRQCVWSYAYITIILFGNDTHAYHSTWCEERPSVRQKKINKDMFTFHYAERRLKLKPNIITINLPNRNCDVRILYSMFICDLYSENSTLLLSASTTSSCGWMGWCSYESGVNASWHRSIGRIKHVAKWRQNAPQVEWYVKMATIRITN